MLYALCFMRAFIGYKLNFHFVSFYFVSCLFCFVRFLLILFFFLFLLVLFFCYFYFILFVLFVSFVLFCFVSFTALLKTFERCIVKPLGQLVRVSSMAHTTYTPRLSTS